jgi:TonB family protein
MVIHISLLIVILAIADRPTTPKSADIDPSTLEKKDLVFLPPASVLRQLVPKLPAPPRPQPQPAPAPTPPPADQSKKDRISIGPPTDLRTKGPLILRREDDLTKVPKGQPSPPSSAVSVPAPTPAPAVAEQRGAGTPERQGREGLRLPPGLTGMLPGGDEGSRRRPSPIESSIPGAIDGVTRRLERDAQLGLPTGTGQNLGGLYFDPRGADFTAWINHFKNEVYRNWIMPQAAQLGFRGHVDFEFTVERNGTMSALRMLKSSGTPSLDRAAQFALTSSHWQPLPDDYGPPRVTMQVAFYYNEAPQGS